MAQNAPPWIKSLPKRGPKVGLTIEEVVLSLITMDQAWRKRAQCKTKRPKAPPPSE